MSIDHELPKTDQLPIVEPADDVEKTRKPRSGKGKRFGIIGGAVAGVAALAAGGAAWLGSGNSNEETPGPTPSASAEPFPNDTDSPNPSPSSSEVLGDDRFSPESLSQLSSEELTELFEITTEEAPTPELYAKLFVEEMEALANAGMNESEWKPFENAGKGEYSSAMLEKYLQPISEGLFGHDGSGLQNFYTIGWDRYNVMSGLGREYSNSIEITHDSITTTTHENGSFDVTFTVTSSDNYNVIDVFGEGPGRDPYHETTSFTLSGVQANEEGVLHPESISEVDL